MPIEFNFPWTKKPEQALPEEPLPSDVPVDPALLPPTPKVEDPTDVDQVLRQHGIQRTPQGQTVYRVQAPSMHIEGTMPVHQSAPMIPDRLTREETAEQLIKLLLIYNDSTAHITPRPNLGVWLYDHNVRIK